MSKLCAGCGTRPKQGWVNLDFVKLPGVDVVWNLDRFPYPFPDSTFEEVDAEDVVEHLENPIAAVQEFGRILAAGGKLRIAGPPWDDPEILWSDLTHRRAFAMRTFDGFDPETFDGQYYGHYHGPIKFKVVSRMRVGRQLVFILIKR